METQFTINDNPSKQDIAFLEEKIIEFNCATTGFNDGKYLSIFVRNEKNEIVAGISGFTWGGYCEIEWLWVHHNWRYQKYGKQMLLALEAEARARYCEQIVVCTHSFQAPDFYKKHGYEIFGILENSPKNYQKIYLKKRLK